MKITVNYKASDGFKESKTFTKIAKAKAWAIEWVGDTPNFGAAYAVSYDGVGTIRCKGCTIQELFEAEEINPLKKENETMKLKENFVIGSSDARFSTGPLKKAKAAVKAVKAVEAVEAVEAVKAVKANKKEGIEAVKAVKAVKGVKGVKGVEATPATPQVQTAYFRGKTKEICEEILARCADQGYTDALNGQILEDDKGSFYVTFKAEQISTLRAMFKKCKAKDGYNAPGLKAQADAAKAEKAAKAKKAKAEKAAEKEKEAKAAAKDKAKDKTPEDKAPEKDSEPGKDSDVDWPENFDD